MSRLLVLIPLLLLAACSGNRQAAALLDRIDSLTCEQPDSALRLLQQHEAEAATWSRSLQMRHALLTARAQNKAFVDFTTDSVLLVLSGTTTFTVKTVSGTALTEGTDYSINGGVITFLVEQSEKVYVEMLNTAFPKFTATAPFKTTEFTVPTTVGIHEMNAASAAGKMYNLQGVEVMNAGKGIYIQNGKKVIVK